MGTERLGSVLLSILLLTSLITPLLFSIAVTSVGTVKADSAIFSDDFSTAIDADARYSNWDGGKNGTTVINDSWRKLSSTTGAPKQGAGRLGLLPSSATTDPFINAPSFATTGYNSIKISFVWAREPNTGDTRTTTFDVFWSTDGTTWNLITGAGYAPDTEGNSKTISNVSVGSDANVGDKPTLYIKWRSNGRGGGSGGSKKVSFDDVVITGSLGGGEGVNVSISPSENSGLPETTLTYTVLAKNTSAVLDNYTLTVTDNEGWGPTLDDNLFLNVGPGENRTTTLRVTIPADAEEGAEDLITVTATSLENENITDNGSCKAICYLVPPPQHYKEYPTDDQAVMEGMGNLSEDYKYKLPCGRYHENDLPRERSFLKFDISSIPPGATIENAYLGVYHHFGVYTEGRWCWVEVWTVENDNWTENEIDWDNQPPKIENLYHEYINYTGYSPNPWLGTIHGWPGVPVESYIQSQVENENDGVASFVLYSPQEDLDPSENTDVDFTATDDTGYPTQWPYLEVWYYENLPPVLFSVTISPGSQAGWPGENLEYTVTVKNSGTINDNYDLEVSDDAIPSWGPTLSEYLLDNVPPGENRTVTLSVTVPENEELATLDRITVTATSQADNRISESAEAIATGSGFWIVASYSPFIESYAVGVTGAGENIYIANSDPDRFMCYNSVSDTWQNLSVPSGLLWQPGKPGSTIGAFKNGTCMAWDNGDYLYTLFGASYADGDSGYYRHYFYRYSISNDNWEQLENTLNPKGQGAGDAITWVPGSVLGTGNDWIYAIVGSADHGTSFWRYNINTDTWESRSFNPGWTTTDDGCSLVWTGDNYLYALRGEWMESSPCYDFARYDLLYDNWEDMAPIPAYPWGGGAGGVGDGGSLLWIGGEYSDHIYALSGNQCIPEPIYDNRFYLYTISTNTWQRLADMPGGVGSQNGPRLGFASGSRGKIYCWKGCNGDPVLWAYLPTRVEPPSEVEVRLGPIDDSGVSEGYPDNNYGAVYNMYNGWSPEYLSQRNYLKFNVSSIPSGSVIKSATLWATGRFGPSGATFDDFTWHLVDAMTVENDDWSESTITWNNAPPMGSVLDTDNFASYAFVDYWNWLSWDVTDFVASEFLGDQLVSIGLKRQDPENAYNSSGWFATKDSISWTIGYEPYLEITYAPVESYAVRVSIDPEYQSGSPGDTLNYTVTVANIGLEDDNFDLEVSDNESWGLSLSDNLLEIPAGENENVTLSVTIPGDAEYCTEDLITVTATSRTDNTVKDSASCIARTGTAAFSLKNLYTVNVEKILDLENGSKLVVKFYDYSDAYENENVVETFSPPWHVEENELARHPENVGVKKVRLDLTYENTENVISTIASYTVRKIDLEARFLEIPFYWAQAPPGSQERLDLETEFLEISFYWSGAPD